MRTLMRRTAADNSEVDDAEQVQAPVDAPPLLTVIGAGGGAGVTTTVTMLGPLAQERHRDCVTAPPEEGTSPWLLICCGHSVTHAARAIELRDHALDAGWRVAAIVTVGPSRVVPKAVSTRLSVIADDPVDNAVLAMPYWPGAQSLTVEELPWWDTTRQTKKAKRTDGVPRPVAALFTQLLDYIITADIADAVFRDGEDDFQLTEQATEEYPETPASGDQPTSEHPVEDETNLWETVVNPRGPVELTEGEEGDQRNPLDVTQDDEVTRHFAVTPAQPIELDTGGENMPTSAESTPTGGAKKPEGVKVSAPQSSAELLAQIRAARNPDLNPTPHSPARGEARGDTAADARSVHIDVGGDSTV